MAARSDNHGEEKMHRAVELREQRDERGRKEGERSLWQNMSMIGALGWLIVTPTLIGVFVGRWLDGRFDTGIQFTGALIFVGICFGCYLAWHRIVKE
jgi:ATP synthase protein I